MKNLLIGLIIALVIGVVILFVALPSDSDNGVPTNDGGNGDGGIAGIEETKIKEFDLTGENFKFIMNGVDNPDLIVNEGDTVRITFTSTSGFHDWVVDEFNAATTRVNDNGVTNVEFVADQKGSFEYYCSVGQHRANGMKGNLIVQ
jgi:plastocyanin